MSRTEYENWHPQQQIAATAEAFKTARPRNKRKIYARNRPPAEQTAVTTAQQLECPQGFGEGQHRMHWIPPSETGCARCGKEAQEITAQLGAKA